MTLTASLARSADTAHRPHEMHRWAAAVLAVAGNILVVAIVAFALAGTAAAAGLVFGPALLAQI